MSTPHPVAGPMWDGFLLSDLHVCRTIFADFRVRGGRRPPLSTPRDEGVMTPTDAVRWAVDAACRTSTTTDKPSPDEES